MLRSASFFSIALHAGLLLLINSSSAPIGFITAGPGTSGAGFSILINEPAPEAAQDQPAVDFSLELAVAPEPVSKAESLEGSAPSAEIEVPELPAAKLSEGVREGAEIQVLKTEPGVKKASKGKSASPRIASADSRGGSSGNSVGGGAEGKGGRGGFGGGAGYVPPQYLLRYKPPYPEAARARELEGTVLLLVSVDARGTVTGVSLHRSCGHEILDRSALGAVRNWKFMPARQDGREISSQVEVPVRFRFEARRISA